MTLGDVLAKLVINARPEAPRGALELGGGRLQATPQQAAEAALGVYWGFRGPLWKAYWTALSDATQWRELRARRHRP